MCFVPVFSAPQLLTVVYWTNIRSKFSRSFFLMPLTDAHLLEGRFFAIAQRGFLSRPKGFIRCSGSWIQDPFKHLIQHPKRRHKSDPNMDSNEMIAIIVGASVGGVLLCGICFYSFVLARLKRTQKLAQLELNQHTKIAEYESGDQQPANADGLFSWTKVLRLTATCLLLIPFATW